jgi:hypothetical protein
MELHVGRPYELLEEFLIFRERETAEMGWEGIIALLGSLIVAFTFWSIGG